MMGQWTRSGASSTTCDRVRMVLWSPVRNTYTNHTSDMVNNLIYEPVTASNGLLTLRNDDYTRLYFIDN